MSDEIVEQLVCDWSNGKPIYCHIGDGCPGPCCAYCRKYIWRWKRRQHCRTTSCPINWIFGQKDVEFSDFVDHFSYPLRSMEWK